MGVLERFERRIETLVEGAFAKAFRAHVQPVEIARALERELDNRAAIVGAGRTLVPNRFVVELAGADDERLGALREALAAELAQAVTERAKEQHYSFLGPVEVEFTSEPDLDTGVFRVRGEVAADAGAAAGGPRLETATGDVHQLEHVTVIGRGDTVDVRVDDPGASRRHAEVRRDGASYVLSDLGSTNGTLVNGTPVNRHELRDGDSIEIGSTSLVFRVAG